LNFSLLLLLFDEISPIKKAKFLLGSLIKIKTSIGPQTSLVVLVQPFGHLGGDLGLGQIYIYILSPVGNKIIQSHSYKGFFVKNMHKNHQILRKCLVTSA
jgi:hypothetical protein